MMMCLKHLLIYTILLPVPSASPVLLAIFAAAVFWTVRPCGYCITLVSRVCWISPYRLQYQLSVWTHEDFERSTWVALADWDLSQFAILFLSTSPSSPFLNNTATPDLTILSPSTPMPNRTWLNLNHGKIFDPALVGYQPPSAASASSSPAAESDAPVTPPKRFTSLPRDLPSHHLDLRYKGMGFVLDLGWKRSNEGVIWEESSGRISQEVEGEPIEEAKEAELVAVIDEPFKRIWNGMKTLGDW